MYGGKSAEVMVYRKSAPAAFHVTRTGAKERVIKLGRGAAQPVLGDWDGNGRVNPGIREAASRTVHDAGEAQQDHREVRQGR